MLTQEQRLEEWNKHITQELQEIQKNIEEEQKKIQWYQNNISSLQEKQKTCTFFFSTCNQQIKQKIQSFLTQWEEFHNISDTNMKQQIDFLQKMYKEACHFFHREYEYIDNDWVLIHPNVFQQKDYFIQEYIQYMETEEEIKKQEEYIKTIQEKITQYLKYKEKILHEQNTLSILKS